MQSCLVVPRALCLFKYLETHFKLFTTVHTRYTLNASQPFQLPESFSAPLASFGDSSSFLSIQSVAKRSASLSVAGSRFSAQRPASAASRASFKNPTFPLSRSSLRSIRQTQSEVNYTTHTARRFSTASSVPSISYFTSFPLPSSVASRTGSSHRGVFKAASAFFPVQQVSFQRNSLRRFFARRRTSNQITRRVNQSPLLIASNFDETLLTAANQPSKASSSTRYAAS